MKCRVCESERIANVHGHCRDSCHVTFGSLESEGYVPDGLNIGGGDCVEFDYCLDCGSIQAQFPVSTDAVMAALEDSDRNNDR